MKLGLVSLILLVTSKVWGQSIENKLDELAEARANGDHKKAVLISTKILDYYIQKEDSSLEYANLMIYISNSYKEIYEYDKAIDLIDNSLLIYQKLQGLKCEECAYILNELGIVYAEKGDFNKALALSEESQQIFKEVYGIEHPEYLKGQINQASYYSKLGRFEESRKKTEQCLNNLDKKSKNYVEFHIRCSYNLAHSWIDLGENEKALSQYEENIKWLEKNNQTEHNYYIVNRNDLSTLEFELGNLDQARNHLIKNNEIISNRLGKNHPQYAISLANLSLIESKLGNVNHALSLCKEAQEIMVANFDYCHSLSLGTLEKLASIYEEIGDYEKSLNLHKEILKCQHTTIGAVHPDYAYTLSQIATDNSNLGNYKEALLFHNKAHEIRKDTYGPNHPITLTSLNHLAETYAFLSDYDMSLKLYNLVLVERKEQLGNKHLLYASTLMGIASIYNLLNDALKAINYAQEAVSIYHDKYGELNGDYIQGILMLAVLYRNIGDFEKAMSYNKECVNLSGKFYGKNHVLYALSINNLAYSYYDLGNQKEFKELIQKALKIRLNQLGQYHPSYLESLSGLASIKFEEGHTQEALTLAQECVDHRKIIFGSNHPEYIESIDLLAKYYRECGQFTLSDSLMIYAYNQSQQNFIQQSGLTERERLKFKRRLDFRYYDILNKILLYSDSNIASPTVIAELWFNHKGIIYQNANLEIKDDTIIGEKISELNRTRQTAIKMLEQSDLNTIQGRNEILEKVNYLEREINQIINEKTLENRVNVDRISQCLSSKEVYIDIVRFPRFIELSFDFKELQYLVFVINEDGLADYVIIEKGGELEGELYNEYSESTFAKNIEHRVIDQTSYAHFWKPIADKIGAYKTVYVSLVGVYNKINLNTLFNTETEKYLFEEKDIRIVSNARDFVLSKEKEVNLFTNNTASLFGFPNYDGNTTTSADTATNSVFSRDLDPFWIDSLSRGGMKVSLLPGTKLEVENISTSFNNKGWDVSIFIKDDASESIVKQVQSPRVMHIATHGYFFEDIPEDNSDERFMGMDKHEMNQDPLLRSGLLFAGANKTLQGQKMERENGLLSAYEASMLNLKETELVVLSACESGRGEVQNSEGVSGLRKAFSDAGAKNIIMSLWKVDDKVTQEFMTSFYEIWLNEKTSIREAFNKTQLEIKAKYPQPYYWGAFILVGE